MNDLVKLYNGKEPRISTFLIFAHFGYKEHRALKKVIFKNRVKFEKKGALISATTVADIASKGRPDESYLLNERQFVLLVMLAKNTPESIELKDRIETEFYNMRLRLANLSSMRKSEEWVNTRKDGKAVYFQKTDVIKSFVDYATEQGSKSASLYYVNIAKMENKALFFIEQKYPNVREVLNIRQLMQVATADQIIEKALSDGMNENMDYKEIYQMAKNRVIQFSEILGKSMVIEMIDNNKKIG